MAKVNNQTKEIIMNWVNSHEDYKTIHSEQLCDFRDHTEFPLGDRYEREKKLADHYYALYYKIVQSNYGVTTGHYVEEILKRAKAHFHTADSYKVALNFYIKAKVKKHNDKATNLYIKRVFDRTGITTIITEGVKNISSSDDQTAIDKIAVTVLNKIPFREDNPKYEIAIDIADIILNEELEKFGLLDE